MIRPGRTGCTQAVCHGIYRGGGLGGNRLPKKQVVVGSGNEVSGFLICAAAIFVIDRYLPKELFMKGVLIGTVLLMALPLVTCASEFDWSAPAPASELERANGVMSSLFGPRRFKNQVYLASSGLIDCLLNCRPNSGQAQVVHPRPQCFWPVDVLELAECLVGELRGDRGGEDANVITTNRELAP